MKKKSLMCCVNLVHFHKLLLRVCFWFAHPYSSMYQHIICPIWHELVNLLRDWKAWRIHVIIKFCMDQSRRKVWKYGDSTPRSFEGKGFAPFPAKIWRGKDPLKNPFPTALWMWTLLQLPIIQKWEFQGPSNFNLSTFFCHHYYARTDYGVLTIES